MRGPISRIRSRGRSGGQAAQEAPAPPVAAGGDDEATLVVPAGDAHGAEGAGTPAAPSGPGFRDRARLRRRLRYLRRVRELGFRDLGGLLFDLHRFGRQGDELVRAKLTALETVDREMRALERVLDDRRDVLELREPGIAACSRCGALHAAEDRFCGTCGTPVHGPLPIGEVAHPADVPPAPPVGQAPPAPAGPHEPETATPSPKRDVLQPTEAMPALPADEPSPSAREEATTSNPAAGQPDTAANGEAAALRGGDPLARGDRREP